MHVSVQMGTSVPLDVVVLPGQLGVALVQLVHDQVELWRRQVVGQRVVLPRQQALEHVRLGLGDTHVP